MANSPTVTSTPGEAVADLDPTAASAGAAAPAGEELLVEELLVEEVSIDGMCGVY